MADYVPSTTEWVREQVELYERTNGAEGHTLRDSGMPVIIVTNTGNKTGAVRKTPLMRAVDGKNYILVASQGGAPEHPYWYHNLKADPDVEIRDGTEVFAMRVHEVVAEAEKARLWGIAVEAFAPYQTYQDNTERIIPIFVAEPIE